MTPTGEGTAPPSDGYNRRIDYLRISITDRCNLRCFYCMPEGGVPAVPHDKVLRYEEIYRVVEAARGMGFARFRITGGEPLVRRGVAGFLSGLSARGLTYSLTTNGLLLGRLARELAGAGLERVNVGLDTLRPATFKAITRHDGLQDVLYGIDAARGAGISRVKVNVVVMRGVNEAEIGSFIDWARRERLDVRFVEFMPVRGEDHFISLAPWIESFRNRGDVERVEEEGGGPARMFRFRDGSATVGFILPRSRPFCSGCNRLRLTADGTLLPCLFSREGIDVRGPLRRGEPIAPLIARAVTSKPEGHGLKMALCSRGMYAVGG